MHRRASFLTVAVVLILVGVACDTSTATPYSAPTTVPSTATPVPTMTPSPVPPTPIPPTPTPSVQDLLEEFEVPADGIPEGYDLVPPEDLDLSLDALSGEDYSVAQILIFMSDTNQEAGMVLLFALETEDGEDAFDDAIADPVLLVDAFVAQVAGEGEVAEIGPLDDLDAIGDSAAGYAFEHTEEGVEMVIEIVILRRGVVGAMVAVIYPSGNDVAVSAAGLAGVVDTQLEALLD